jgi:uncharacterized protein YfaT (DUF1175 family)
MATILKPETEAPEALRRVGKDINQARPGDVLVFDKGDGHRLMIWMGGWAAYHTGFETPSDDGLRAVSLDQLMSFKDTRWRPVAANPHFVGVFRLVLYGA